MYLSYVTYGTMFSLYFPYKNKLLCFSSFSQCTFLGTFLFQFWLHFLTLQHLFRLSCLICLKCSFLQCIIPLLLLMSAVCVLAADVFQVFLYLVLPILKGEAGTINVIACSFHQPAILSFIFYFNELVRLQEAVRNETGLPCACRHSDRSSVFPDSNNEDLKALSIQTILR